MSNKPANLVLFVTEGVAVFNNHGSTRQVTVLSVGECNNPATVKGYVHN